MDKAQRENTRNNLSRNLRDLRSAKQWSQEEAAERVGVTRQAIAKWESGETLPDILNCEILADLYEVSLNDLVRFDAESEGYPIPPKGKYIFGTVTLSERGQIVLPKKARDIMEYNEGTVLVVLGDTSPNMSGIALVEADAFLRLTGYVLDDFLKGEV